VAVRSRRLIGPSLYQSTGGLTDHLVLEVNDDRVVILRSFRYAFIPTAGGDYFTVAVESPISGLMDMFAVNAAISPVDVYGELVGPMSWAFSPGDKLWVRVFHPAGFGAASVRVWGTGAKLSGPPV